MTEGDRAQGTTRKQPTESSSIEAVYALSPMQEGMLFHSLHHPAEHLYLEQFSCDINGALNVPAFVAAWKAAVQRHAILRTGFVWKRDGSPVQMVHRAVELPFSLDDWSDLAESEQRERLDAFLAVDRSTPFKLSKPPLMRMKLIRRRNELTRFVWTHHHILMDGWSLPHLIQEVLENYDALSTNSSIEREKVRPYGDYIEWLNRQDLGLSENYWRATLSGFTAHTPVVGARTTPVAGVSSDDHAKESLLCPDGFLNDIGRVARQLGVTVASVIHAAWAILLSKYSGEQDVVFGVTVSGRSPELIGMEQMVGLFINTLPLRAHFRTGDRIADLIRRIHQDETELQGYSYTPLVQVQAWSEIPSGVSLFESIVVVENYPVDSSLARRLQDIELTDVVTTERTNYPLTLAAVCRGELLLELAYRKSLHDQQQIHKMLVHLQQLLEQCCSQPEKRLRAISMLSPAEQTTLTQEWPVATDQFVQNDQTVIDLFEECVRRFPESPAIISGDRELTYIDLADRVNVLVERLKIMRVGQETVVAVLCDRSPELVVAFLAVLKAGGTYLPIDPAIPRRRREDIFSLARPLVVITCQGNPAEYEGAEYLELRLEVQPGVAGRKSIAVPPSRQDPLQAAYVIFTSGSTGEPKGVVVSHAGLASFVRSLEGHWPGHDKARVLQFASPSFDASIGEMVLALCFGGALVQVPRDSMYAPMKVAELINSSGVTTVTLPPSVLEALPAGEYLTLKTICAVAEICPWHLAERWSATGVFYNGYGPTEAAIGSTVHRNDGDKRDTSSVPIGRPLAGARIYVLDSHGEPVPARVPGELYIGGAGVGRGYLGRPGLTAERFVPDPFGPHAGARLYRTGDRVRFLDDGVLEFIGRIDRQVKVRGLRIEPEEIEIVLRTHGSVRNAFVDAVPGDNGDTFLAAYVTAREATACDPDNLVTFLRERLPAYMVPARVIILDAMPRTTTGKIDSRALAATSKRDEHESIEHLTPTEGIVAGIWEEVLHCPRPQRKSDFFALGGHSLLATRVATRIQNAFGISVPLDVLFDRRSLDSLAAWIDTSRPGNRSRRPGGLHPVPRMKTMPASFPQRRLWFLERLDPDRAFFVIPSVLRMKGPLDATLLQRCLQECVRRHESLRTTFAEEDGEPVTVIATEGVCPVQTLDRSSVPREQQEFVIDQLLRDESTRPFDLINGPLIRAMLIRLAKDDHIFSLTMHHAVSDGWSAGVLLAELKELYKCGISGSTPALPPLPVQYADFAAWQRNGLTGTWHDELVRYWTGALAGIPAGLDIVTDAPRPRVVTSDGALVRAEIPPDVTDALHVFSNAEAVTPFMTFLAAYHALLYRYSGQETIVVGSPVAGRGDSSLEGIIGCFVNTLALRADVKRDMIFRDLLRQVRATCLDAFAHQDLPFELLVEKLQPERDLSRTPLFQAAFVFQNLDTGTLDLPGVTVTPVAFDNGTAKYELTMTVVPAGDHYSLVLEYNKDLYTETTAHGILRHFCAMLRAAMADPRAPIGRLQLLEQSKRRIIENAWNETAWPYPDSTTAHAWFSRVTAAQPEAPALIWQGNVLTYAELNRNANRIAHLLLSSGVVVEDVVGICLERSPELITGILGILKAGAAFLPLDPVYPSERIHMMCLDARVRAVITTNALQASIAFSSMTVLALDDHTASLMDAPCDDPPITMRPDNLAYVIFTSGSTGRPKGSMLHHQGLCNLAAAQHSMFPLGPGSRVLQFASPSFDASVWELVMTLLSGGTLVLADRESLQTGQGLRDVLVSESVSMITIPPSALAVLPNGPYPDLRSIVVAGERCPADLVDRWQPGRQMVNAYGPTETTVCASTHQCAGRYKNGPPIGKPIPNVRLYILDQFGQIVPPGVPGELYIGGVSVGRGYCGRPDLTAERFLPDPFSADGTRLYRSGDLCRYRHDGEIEFLGRIDTQVKVRGYRIEPGEIQAALTAHPDINTAVVIVREDSPGDQRITAYLVPHKDVRPDLDVLRSHLRRALPAFLVPAAYVVLDAIPLTPSGKVDVRALPRPDLTVPRSSEEDIPVDPMEAELAAICAALLDVPRIGRHDNFFELGGHSLLATRLLARIRDRHGVELPVRMLFEDPTVAGLGAALRAALPRGSNGDHERVQKALQLLDGLSEEEAIQMLRTGADTNG
jgi:amino acid adenylation domain-containing protein